MVTSSKNVSRMVASNEKLQQYITEGKAPHLIPIADALRNHGCGFAIVLPHAGAFRLPNDRPCILFVGDDHLTCEGPTAFHRRSLRKFIQTCRAAAIVACQPIEDIYRTVTNDLRRNVVIVETRGEHESDWYQFITEIKPDITLALGLVRPAGRA